MRTTNLAALAACACISLTSASALADESSGPSFGLRTGYSAALGSARDGQSLASLEGGMLPIWFDLGYRITPAIYVGGFFQYGIIAPPSSGCPGSSCSGYDIRAGIDAQYHFLPTAVFDPWAGLGVGYEVSHVVSANGAGADETVLALSGFQFVDLQLGGDLRLVKHFAFGSFVDLSVGQFSGMSTDAMGPVTSVPFQTALHEWLTIGLRGQIDL